MSQPATDQTKTADRPAPPEPRPYAPPRLGGRQALSEVTLFSGACVPGAPGCTIGHP